MARDVRKKSVPPPLENHLGHLLFAIAAAGFFFVVAIHQTRRPGDFGQCGHAASVIHFRRLTYESWPAKCLGLLPGGCPLPLALGLTGRFRGNRLKFKRGFSSFQVCGLRGNFVAATQTVNSTLTGTDDLAFYNLRRAVLSRIPRFSGNGPGLAALDGHFAGVVLGHPRGNPATFRRPGSHAKADPFREAIPAGNPSRCVEEPGLYQANRELLTAFIRLSCMPMRSRADWC